MGTSVKRRKLAFYLICNKWRGSNMSYERRASRWFTAPEPNGTSLAWRTQQAQSLGDKAFQTEHNTFLNPLNNYFPKLGPISDLSLSKSTKLWNPFACRVWKQLFPFDILQRRVNLHYLLLLPFRIWTTSKLFTSRDDIYYLAIIPRCIVNLSRPLWMCKAMSTAMSYVHFRLNLY